MYLRVPLRSPVAVNAHLSSRPPARPPSLWHLALRQTWRDFQAGELRLLALAVMLAVAALSAVAFFADRINAGLARDARQLLGGDAIVSSDKPTPPEVLARAQALGLQVATTAGFPSMGRAPEDRGGAARLVAVKAVSDGYPLRGVLQVRDAPDAPVVASRLRMQLQPLRNEKAFINSYYYLRKYVVPIVFFGVS